MRWFKRKEKAEEIPAIPEYHCSHRWKDFDWYIEGTWQSDSNTVSMRIIEPYVCIHCKERKNVTLQEATRCDIRSLREAQSEADEWVKLFGDRVKEQAIVEDQINDFQLVDRAALEIARRLDPAAGI